MPEPTRSRRILIASNRGPISFVRGSRGRLEPKRSPGGLVTALTGALQAAGGMWLASAMSEEDRAKTGRSFDADLGGARCTLKYLAFDPATYGRFYDGISNRVLWFVHHQLWDVPRYPRFEGLAADWAAYRSVNEGFAASLGEEGGVSPVARYLIQDYHLALVPGLLRAKRPSARIAHFSHIPFAGPSYFEILPGSLREQILAGMLGADVVGFQAPMWAENFLMCCRSLPGARVDLRRRIVRWAGRDVSVRVYPISIDPQRLAEEASTAEVADARRSVQRVAGEGRLLVRVDRAELSKNILRGLLAFESLLDAEPAWRSEVSFLALLNPSRTHLSEYRAYTRECVEAARRVNRRFARRRWTPIRLSLKDDYARALAAYQLYDVLLVNPVFDGMNLVAKEGPTLNERDGVLVLSETAGASAELGRHALLINPFDVEATAGSLSTALDMDAAQRRTRARGLRAAVARNPIDRWVNAQLEDLDRIGG